MAWTSNTNAIITQRETCIHEAHMARVGGVNYSRLFGGVDTALQSFAKIVSVETATNGHPET